MVSHASGRKVITLRERSWAMKSMFSGNTFTETNVCTDIFIDLFLHEFLVTCLETFWYFFMTKWELFLILYGSQSGTYPEHHCVMDIPACLTKYCSLIALMATSCGSCLLSCADYVVANTAHHCLGWLSFPEPFLLCWQAKCAHCGGQWWWDGGWQVWEAGSWWSWGKHWEYCRVRVSWGQVENFKCVDYFQIEYYEESDPAGTAKLTGKINRHRKSHDIDIKPCSDYLFKVGNKFSKATNTYSEYRLLPLRTGRGWEKTSEWLLTPSPSG